MFPSVVARGLLAACLLLIFQNPGQNPSIRFDSQSSAFLLEGLGEFTVEDTELPKTFTVSVDAPDVPPMLGSYSRRGHAILFTPQFPLQAGLKYRAIAHIRGLYPISLTVDVPKPEVRRTTVVQHIYPSASTLPENQLKFYIQFSNPMSRGEAYEHIVLLDTDGVKVERPFLELGEELWDFDTQRFTLFFDPGRIKRGLVPNAQLGLAIREGKQYTLVIDNGWHDAEGAELVADFRKTFNVGPAERQLLDPKTWRVKAPKRATRQSVMVEFPRPLDQALVQRQLQVLDSTGQTIAGYITVDRDETRWSLTPTDEWKTGEYSIQIGNILADLAGNMVDRPFEIDLLEKTDSPPNGFIWSIPFTID